MAEALPATKRTSELMAAVSKATTAAARRSHVPRDARSMRLRRASGTTHRRSTAPAPGRAKKSVGAGKGELADKSDGRQPEIHGISSVISTNTNPATKPVRRGRTNDAAGVLGAMAKRDTTMSAAVARVPGSHNDVLA
jgi:hypothetical protein